MDQNASSDPRGQLDLFIDSRATQLANAVLAALLEHRAGEVAARLNALRSEAPDHPLIDALQKLCGALQADLTVARDDSTAERLVEWLDAEITMAASATLGPAASRFMEPLWQAVADIRQEQPYRRSTPSSFCAALYLRAGNPAAALRAVACVPNPSSHADALHWLAVGSFRTEGLRAARPPLFRLAWLCPQRLSATVEAIADANLLGDWNAFSADSDEFEFEHELAADGAWFPAWYLLPHPTTQLSSAQLGNLPDTAAIRAFFALQRLLRLEPHGHGAELIEARQALRRDAPPLFALYMRRREFRAS